MLKIRGIFIKTLFLITAVCFCTRLNASTVLSQPIFSFYQSVDDSQGVKSIVNKYQRGHFERLDGTFANFGRTEKLYWLHFSLSATETKQKRMLEIDNSHIYDIKVYQMKNSGFPRLVYHTGINKTFEQRPYPARNFVFPIGGTGGGQNHYFISLDRRQEVLKFNIRLVDDYVYIPLEKRIYWFYGCFAGILIFIMIFNVFLRIALNDPVHTWYILYILFILLFVLADTGLGYEFLWGNFPAFNKHIRTFAGLIAFFLQLHFMQLFISQTANNSRLYRIVNWNKYGFLLLTSVAMLTLLFDFTFSTWGAGLFHNLFSIAYISGIVLVALSLAEKISSANRTGIIYLIAVSPLILQVLVVILARWRLFTLPVDTSLSMTIAILVEIIILTLGLTIRYNYFKVEKDKLENALAWQRKITVEKVLAAQEEERRRVASDLHDGLGGTLASVKGMLSAISQSHSDRTLEKLIDSQNLLDKACDDLRYIAHDLMPADFSNTSLHLAVEELVSKLYGSSEIEFSYVLGGKHRLLDKYLELNIYRILNELVHNIRKHSNATRAIVQLIYHDDFLQLMVEDNGRGFDTRSTESDAGIGLKNIQSRTEYINAKIYFDSSKLGTTVTCNVPYPI